MAAPALGFVANPASTAGLVKSVSTIMVTPAGIVVGVIVGGIIVYRILSQKHEEDIRLRSEAFDIQRQADQDMYNARHQQDRDKIDTLFGLISKQQEQIAELRNIKQQ